jgi:hypothetical protein
MMDLLTIARLLRKHLALSLSVICLTVLAGLALFWLMPSQYASQASFVLANPAEPPTAWQIAQNPELGGVNYNNPYLRFTNDTTVSQVLSDRIEAEAVRQEMVAAGADGNYSIAPSTSFGSSGQILGLTATGASPAQADLSMQLVTQRMKQELLSMQKVYGADDGVLITALPVAPPSVPKEVLAGSVRSLVGIAGAGVILLFAAISISERLPSSKANGRRRHVARPEALDETTMRDESPPEVSEDALTSDPENRAAAHRTPSAQTPTG